MKNQSSELIEKIRQQFNFGPYPRIPLERSPKDEPTSLYLHNLVTPYYLRNKKLIQTEDKLILDAGCGSGYKSLILAEANPGAKIVGIDISEKSLDLARQRLKHHGFENAEFHLLSIYDLPSLGLEFDYINCDELLYLFPEPALALEAMKSVLKPQGIIRSNLHSSHQRVSYFRAQKLFEIMGLMEGNPEDMEIEIALETMKALKDGVDLKAKTWHTGYEGEDGKQSVLMNYLFQGDKGYSISELFAALRAADLEFISMVNWRQWELIDLFKEPDNLPVFWSMSLPEIPLEERLRIFEILHPIHRLLDFWCGHPEQTQPWIPVADWTTADWQEAKVHLHPQLKTPTVKAEIVRCVTQLNSFEISKYLLIPGWQSVVDSTIAACLLPLLESAQSMRSLVELWQKLYPVNPVTLEAITNEEAITIVRQALTGLEEQGYVMIEL
ncbi:MAG: class I SAM-dependent methyltransferase [Symploca sp. SIO2C1]|nr:class I SAM-dependent methyltransferase [Symploca sp. SIO2C1]